MFVCGVSFLQLPSGGALFNIRQTIRAREGILFDNSFTPYRSNTGDQFNCTYYTGQLFFCLL